MCVKSETKQEDADLITAGDMVDDLNGTIALVARQLVADGPVWHGPIWTVTSLQAVDGLACWALQSTVLADVQTVNMVWHQTPIP